MRADIEIPDDCDINDFKTLVKGLANIKGWNFRIRFTFNSKILITNTETEVEKK